MPETEESLHPSTEDFAAMFEASPAAHQLQEGRVITATVCRHENDFLVLDVGLKTEGRVPAREFGRDKDLPNVGDLVEVYLERVENALGDAVLSREKARREEAWDVLEGNHVSETSVTGTIVGRVKGGFTVDLGGVNAFLPGSQVDIRPVRDITPLMNEDQPFAILKMDRPRGNIVVSRRAVLEESRAEQRAEIVEGMREGEKRRGVVKNITDYGVFVDLGGIDGLLHVTDMSWKRISHPGKLVEVGQELEIQIIRINAETQRISLGMKQLTADPWLDVENKYPKNMKIKGIVANITEYGAFVELEEGVEGLIHVSEMSWTQKNVLPDKILSNSQEVEVMILDVDTEKRRISLGLKQVLGNPWEEFLEENPQGTQVTGDIRSITEFGMFVALTEDLDGMIHINDLDWNIPGDQAVKSYRKGQTVSATVLDVDVGKERISLGIKQLTDDPFRDPSVSKDKIVTCTIAEVTPSGLSVRFGATDNPSHGFIRKAELSRDRSEQRPERFAAGEKVDAIITSIDKASRRVNLSIKVFEIRTEEEAVAQYGSADSGASLGDILGAALAGQQTDGTTDASGDSSQNAKEETAPSAKDAPASKTADREPETPARTARKSPARKKTAKSNAETADAPEGKEDLTSSTPDASDQKNAESQTITKPAARKKAAKSTTSAAAASKEKTDIASAVQKKPAKTTKSTAKAKTARKSNDDSLADKSTDIGGKTQAAKSKTSATKTKKTAESSQD